MERLDALSICEVISIGLKVKLLLFLFIKGFVFVLEQETEVFDVLNKIDPIFSRKIGLFLLSQKNICSLNSHFEISLDKGE